MKHIHAGIIAQPAGNNAHARCSHSHHAPRTQGGPPRLDSSHAAGRPTSPLYRRRPGHRFVRTPPDADKRLAAEERISRRNPTPQHPQRAANLIAHRRRTSPPTSRASVAGGADRSLVGGQGDGDAMRRKGGECVGGYILREGGETGAKGCPIVLGTIRLIPPETPASSLPKIA